MICPKCKKEVENNVSVCPECGLNIAQNKKVAAILMFIILAFLIFQVSSCTSDFVDEAETSKAKNVTTQEDINQARDYLITLEASGLIKGIEDNCADGSKGCYRIIVDDYLWNTQADYKIKENIVMASDIYLNSKENYRFFEGIGYKSGKKLFDMWGIK